MVLTLRLVANEQSNVRTIRSVTQSTNEQVRVPQLGEGVRDVHWRLRLIAHI